MTFIVFTGGWSLQVMPVTGRIIWMRMATYDGTPQ